MTDFNAIYDAWQELWIIDYTRKEVEEMLGDLRKH